MTAAVELCKSGVIAPEYILFGDLTIMEASRRNHNILVRGADGVGFLLKQPGSFDLGTNYTLRKEIAFYTMVASEERFSPISAIIPEVAFCSLKPLALATRLLKLSTSMWVRYSEFERTQFPTDLPFEVGRTTGLLHRVGASITKMPAESAAWLDVGLPPVFDLFEPDVIQLSSLSTGCFKLIRLVQRQEGFLENIAAVKLMWKSETIIHGDLKSDNILISRTQTGSKAQWTVHFVDWETVRLGDSAWDIAGLFYDFIALFVSSLSSETDIRTALEDSRYALRVLRPAVRELWFGYQSERNESVPEQCKTLLRASSYLAVRLLQGAYEATANTSDMNHFAAFYVEIAKSVFADAALFSVRDLGVVLC